MRSVRREAKANGSGKVVLPIDLSGISVFIAMPAHRDIPPATVLSLLDSHRVAAEYGIAVQLSLEIGVADVSLARTICVHRFLHQSKANKLFWIDSDMEWTPDAFMRMLAISTKVDAVIGAYPEKCEPTRFHVGTNGKVGLNDYGCLPVTSGGM